MVVASQQRFSFFQPGGDLGFLNLKREEEETREKTP